MRTDSQRDALASGGDENVGEDVESGGEGGVLKGGAAASTIQICGQGCPRIRNMPGPRLMQHVCGGDCWSRAASALQSLL